MKATDVDEVLPKLDKAINGTELLSFLHTLDPLISSQTAWTAFYTQLSQCICQTDFFGAMSKMNQAEANTNDVADDQPGDKQRGEVSPRRH